MRIGVRARERAVSRGKRCGGGLRRLVATFVHGGWADLERWLGEVLGRVGVDEHVKLLDVALVEAPQQLAEPLERAQLRPHIRMGACVFMCTCAWRGWEGYVASRRTGLSEGAGLRRLTSFGVPTRAPTIGVARTSPKLYTESPLMAAKDMSVASEVACSADMLSIGVYASSMSACL